VDDLELDEGTELGVTELVVATELLETLDELELLGLPSTTTKKLRVAECWPPLPSLTVKVAVWPPEANTRVTIAPVAVVPLLKLHE